MITTILFDVGETLVHNGLPFPNAVEALKAIAKFKSGSGTRIVMGIISDFGGDDSHATEDQIQAAEAEFKDILRTAGLEDFFKPFGSRVTISARAGAFKPDRKIFELAVKRSGNATQLSQCLFITENRDHLLAAQGLEMSVIGFGSNIAGMKSFSKWIDAPQALAQIVAPDQMQNLESAISVVLNLQKGVENFKCLNKVGRTLQGQGTQLVLLDRPELGELNGAFIEVPVDVAVQCDVQGTVTNVVVHDVSDEDVEDAVSFIQQLDRKGMINRESQTTTRATHAVTVDDQGRRVITRQRFSSR